MVAILTRTSPQEHSYPKSTNCSHRKMRYSRSVSTGVVGGEEVDAAIEVADPEVSACVGGKGGDVAVGQDARGIF